MDMAMRPSTTLVNFPKDVEGNVVGKANLQETTPQRMERGLQRFARRMRGDGKIIPSWKASLWDLFTCSRSHLLSGWFPTADFPEYASCVWTL
jgi:hypothetical protein